VYAHVEANEGAILQRLSTGDGDWKDVCAVPCDGYVPAFGSYRISSLDRAPSAPFTLPGPPGTGVALERDSDGNVWTTDSVQLQAQRARSAARSAALLWWLLMLRR
jgi:hypothetical protein